MELVPNEPPLDPNEEDPGFSSVEIVGRGGKEFPPRGSPNQRIQWIRLRKKLDNGKRVLV